MLRVRASDLVAAALILPGSVVTADRIGVDVITLVIACPGQGENRPYGRGDQDTAHSGVHRSMLSLLRSGSTRISHVDSRRRPSRLAQRLPNCHRVSVAQRIALPWRAGRRGFEGLQAVR